MKQHPVHTGYAVTEDGRVFSLNYKRSGRTGVLKPYKHSRGYQVVELGRGNRKLVHHLVLETFVGERPERYETCHKNGIKTDNRLENLHWCTHSENITDNVRMGIHNFSRKTA